MTTQQIDTLITKLGKAAQNVRNATNRTQREAAITFLVKRANELRDIRDEYFNATTSEGRLVTAWDWLDANEDSSKFDDNLDKFSGMVKAYERICDALEDGKQAFAPMAVVA